MAHVHEKHAVTKTGDAQGDTAAPLIATTPSLNHGWRNGRPKQPAPDLFNHRAAPSLRGHAAARPAHAITQRPLDGCGIRVLTQGPSRARRRGGGRA